VQAIALDIEDHAAGIGQSPLWYQWILRSPEFVIMKCLRVILQASFVPFV
jgi:hypothetical protein